MTEVHAEGPLHLKHLALTSLGNVTLHVALLKHLERAAEDLLEQKVEPVGPRFGIRNSITQARWQAGILQMV